jgi:hypothetical protein
VSCARFNDHYARICWGECACNICRAHQPALQGGFIHSKWHYLCVCLSVCLPVCLSVWINRTAVLFCQENIYFADKNQKNTHKFRLTWRRTWFELMRSAEVSITFNANKTNQGVRHFYEVLNTGVHNVCGVFLFTWVLVCWINKRLTDLVHTTDPDSYQSVFYSTICAGWIRNRIKQSSQSPSPINASTLFSLISSNTVGGDSRRLKLCVECVRNLRTLSGTITSKTPA